MTDKRIQILMRISEEYGILCNEDEAIEQLEIFDKVTKEINSPSKFEIKKSTRDEIKRIEKIIENTNKALDEVERRKKERSVIYSRHYHEDLSNRLTWSLRYLNTLKELL